MTNQNNSESKKVAIIEVTWTEKEVARILKSTNKRHITVPSVDKHFIYDEIVTKNIVTTQNIKNN